MSLEFRTITSFTENFSSLIKKDIYEQKLCNLMNQSALVFPGQYHKVTEQPHSECDFIEIATGIKFDAKLPFKPKQGKLIGSKNRNFEKWLSLTMQQIYDFGEDIVETRGKNISSLEIYKIIEKRISTLAEDEHCILFFPYPINFEMENFDFLFFCSDILDAILKELKSQDKIRDRKIYAIYPSLDGYIVLRNINDNQREYIRSDEFIDFVTYDFQIDKM